jgi:hypothetical protein
MYIILSKKPRKTNRGKSKRYRAKLKAKNAARRARLVQWKARKRRTTKKRGAKKRAAR